MAKYTKKEIFILFLFCLGHFCLGSTGNIQGPFYPGEADLRGIKPSQYGFIFGIYHLVILATSLLYGRYQSSIGVKLVNDLGLFTMGVAMILFGYLSKMYDSSTFLGFSFAIRIVEALGASAFKTASYAIVAKKFARSVSSAFGFLETFYGFGAFIAPTLGAFLYNIGGFQLPFSVIGGLFLVTTVLLIFAVDYEEEETKNQVSLTLIKSFISIPSVVLSCFTVFGVIFLDSFLDATLAPHLTSINISQLQVGVMFSVAALSYCVSGPWWGYLCDKLRKPRVVNCVGSLLITVCLTFLGPAPYLHMTLTVPICYVGVFFWGLGAAACIVGSFACLNRDAVNHGFEENITTSSIIASLFTTSLSLGGFIGSPLAGVLYDTVGFPWASQVVVTVHLMLAMVSVISICLKTRENCDRSLVMELL